jgi:ribosomal protein S18 acetylase RimI-like enzyme
MQKTHHPLDNPIWNALSTRQSDMSLGDDLARRYKPIYTTLAGVTAATDEAFASLAAVATSGDRVGLCALEPLSDFVGWQSLGAFPCAQMVCDKLIECKEQVMNVLNDDDIPEMIELAKLTQPGPFAERTIDFGTFYGIRIAPHPASDAGIRDGAAATGKLVAMAGERMKIAGGYDEVSAVCTHPEYQGRGMARALVQAVTKNIFARGRIPMLHVRADNAAAIRSYEALGFRERRQLIFTLMQRI